jgi:hypothetical protein
MNTETKIKLCDILLSELAERNSINTNDVYEIIKANNNNDLRTVLNALIADNLITEYSFGRSVSIEITSLGYNFRKKGYSGFLEFKEKELLEPLKYYRATRYIAYFSLSVAILSLLASIFSLLKSYNLNIL